MSKRGHKTGTIDVVSKALQEVGPMTLAEMMDYTGFTKSACSHALRDLNRMLPTLPKRAHITQWSTITKAKSATPVRSTHGATTPMPPSQRVTTAQTRSAVGTRSDCSPQSTACSTLAVCHVAATPERGEIMSNEFNIVTGKQIGRAHV